jgi:hypothetical protein
LEKQLIEALAVDERRKETGSIRVIQINQRAQFVISTQRFAEQRFVIAIKRARMFGLRTTGAHPGLR